MHNGHIRIKHLLTDDNDVTSTQINEKGKAIAHKLEICPSFDDQDIIANFKGVNNLSDFNEHLDDLYDYCDMQDIRVS